MLTFAFAHRISSAVYLVTVRALLGAILAFASLTVPVVLLIPKWAVDVAAHQRSTSRGVLVNLSRATAYYVPVHIDIVSAIRRTIPYKCIEKV